MNRFLLTDSVFRIIVIAFLVSFIAASYNTVKAQGDDLSHATPIDLISNGLVPRVQIKNDPIYYNLLERMEHYDVPGFSIAVIENGVISSASGFGFARLNEGVKVDEKTIFQAGSISKSVTAVLILKLHQDGILNIDEDIRHYLKSWKLPPSKYLESHKVTLRMLLNHTSGLKVQQRVKIDHVGYHQDEDAPSLNEVLDGLTPLQKIEFDTIPGRQHKYSNQGFTLIQKILEDITNEKFEKLAQKMILDPFEMDNSTFEIVKSNTASIDYAYSYRHGEVKSGYWRHNASKCSGGLYSTPSDLAKFIIKVASILDGQDDFLNHQLAQELIAGEHYGLGFDLYKKDHTNLISHSGRNSGFFAYMAIDQNSNSGYVMMTNSDDANDLFAEVLRGAARVLDWDYAHPKYIETIQLDSDDILTFVGDYVYSDEEDTETLRIVQRNNSLEYFVLEEEEPIMYPLGASSKSLLIDLIDGNTLEFIKKDGEIYKIIYDDEYEYFRVNR